MIGLQQVAGYFLVIAQVIAVIANYMGILLPANAVKVRSACVCHSGGIVAHACQHVAIIGHV